VIAFVSVVADEEGTDCALTTPLTRAQLSTATRMSLGDSRKMVRCRSLGRLTVVADVTLFQGGCGAVRSGS